jgi:hypothetical protein
MVVRGHVLVYEKVRVYGIGAEYVWLEAWLDKVGCCGGFRGGETYED